MYFTKSHVPRERVASLLTILEEFKSAAAIWKQLTLDFPDKVNFLVELAKVCI